MGTIIANPVLQMRNMRLREAESFAQVAQLGSGVARPGGPASPAMLPSTLLRGLQSRAKRGQIANSAIWAPDTPPPCLGPLSPLISWQSPSESFVTKANELGHQPHLPPLWMRRSYLCPSTAPHWAAGPRCPGRWAHQVGRAPHWGVQPPGSLSGWRRRQAGCPSAPPCPPLPAEKSFIQPCPTSSPPEGLCIHSHREVLGAQENQCWGGRVRISGSRGYEGPGAPRQGLLSASTRPVWDAWARRFLMTVLSIICLLPHPSIPPSLSSHPFHLSTHPHLCLSSFLPTGPYFPCPYFQLHPIPPSTHPSIHLFSLQSLPVPPSLSVCPSPRHHPAPSCSPRGLHRCWPGKGWG